MMKTEQIISWLRDKAARTGDHSHQRMLTAAADRLGELEGRECWIPVAERLPKPGERVLVCVGAVFEAFIDDAEKWKRYYSAPLNEVLGNPTYWMPMPEPPKEGK